MSVVDISGLGTIEPAQPLDLSIYPENRPVREFPKAGRYTIQAPEAFPSEAFSKTRADNLSARVDPTIVGPSNEGYELRFTNLSAKVYQTREGKDTSQMGQYLQAFGIEEQLTGQPQQAVDLIASTAGQTADVYADWVAEHRPSGFKLTGMKNFPSDGNGGYQPWIVHPDETVHDNKGNRLRLRANLVVRRWLSAKEV